MEKKTVARVLSMGVLCGLVTSGCSPAERTAQPETPATASSPRPVETMPTPSVSPTAAKVAVASCTALSADKWSRVPGNLNTDKMAEMLGVSTAEINGGLAGNATCRTEVNLDRISEGLVVSVDGIQVDKCLVIAGDRPGGMTKNIGVVCTAPKNA